MPQRAGRAASWTLPSRPPTGHDLRVMLGRSLIFSDRCARHVPSDPYRFGPPVWCGACPGWDWWQPPARSEDAPA
jgi:hypothetical protein